MSDREWRLPLPWAAPPLTLNQRLHWAQKARLTAEVRRLTAVLAKGAGIPPLERCEVTLYWTPRDARRRDEDQLVGTLKPACDGLVDAGVVPDDTPEWMTKRMPVIAAAGRPARLWLVVAEV